ncbi:hypothetical protein SAMN05216464_11733 [Mucilaginibacter pineti]|uniref:DUF5362 domain-containing protein n=1 Tax=Mucilaginibacter pineti TaxID=1391627 RepID=A0A1G7KPK0_9SPHI|nr:DUF5362 family protein [Mucilaginibacter pineti]SDF39105.1 hypothetical protein SAMN05216464_11733 [Mucilaginibacter pineti]
MDVIETPEKLPEPFPQPEIVLTKEAQYYLATATKWATFLGILGFIFCGLFLIFSLSFGAIVSQMAKFMPYNPATAMMAGMGGGVIVFSLLIDLLYFFFALYIYQFATKVKAGIKFQDSALITKGLEKLKSFFKLWGIVTIVIIAIYILSFIGVIIFAATMKSAAGF